jgi:hypothetical protein
MNGPTTRDGSCERRLRDRSVGDRDATGLRSRYVYRLPAAGAVGGGTSGGRCRAYPYFQRWWNRSSGDSGITAAVRRETDTVAGHGRDRTCGAAIGNTPGPHRGFAMCEKGLLGGLGRTRSPCQAGQRQHPKGIARYIHLKILPVTVSRIILLVSSTKFVIRLTGLIRRACGCVRILSSAGDRSRRASLRRHPTTLRLHRSTPANRLS